MRKKFLFFLIVLVVFFPSLLTAYEFKHFVEGEEFKKYDSFFFRLRGGFALSDINTEYKHSEKKEKFGYDAGGFIVDANIGLSLNENLLLGLELVRVDTGTFSYDDDCSEEACFGENVIFNGAGFNMNYYFGTSNFYFSGTLGINELLLSNSQSSDNSKIAFFGMLSFGGETRVNTNTSLGISAYVLYSRAYFDDKSQEYSHYISDLVVDYITMGLLFGFTYK